MSLCFEHHDFIDDSDTLFSILVASDIGIFPVFVPPREFTLRACWNLIEISLPSSSRTIITDTEFIRSSHTRRCPYNTWLIWMQRLHFWISLTLTLLKHPSDTVAMITMVEFLTFGWNKRWLLLLLLYAGLIGSIFCLMCIIFELGFSCFINCRKLSFWHDCPRIIVKHTV